MASFGDFIREYSTEHGQCARASFNSDGRLYFAFVPLLIGHLIFVVLMLAAWPLWVLWRIVK